MNQTLFSWDLPSDITETSMCSLEVEYRLSVMATKDGGVLWHNLTALGGVGTLPAEATEFTYVFEDTDHGWTWKVVVENNIGAPVTESEEEFFMFGTECYNVSISWSDPNV